MPMEAKEILFLRNA